MYTCLHYFIPRGHSCSTPVPIAALFYEPRLVISAIYLAYVSSISYIEFINLNVCLFIHMLFYPHFIKLQIGLHLAGGCHEKLSILEHVRKPYYSFIDVFDQFCIFFRLQYMWFYFSFENKKVIG